MGGAVKRQTIDQCFLRYLAEPTVFPIHTRPLTHTVWETEAQQLHSDNLCLQRQWKHIVSLDVQADTEWHTCIAVLPNWNFNINSHQIHTYAFIQKALLHPWNFKFILKTE